MTYNCKRCKHNGELRKGTVTGDNVAQYAALEKKINQSGILTLNRLPMPNNLCLPCMRELFAWLTSASTMPTP